MEPKTAIEKIREFLEKEQDTGKILFTFESTNNQINSHVDNKIKSFCTKLWDTLRNTAKTIPQSSIHYISRHRIDRCWWKFFVTPPIITIPVRIVVQLWRARILQAMNSWPMCKSNECNAPHFRNQFVKQLYPILCSISTVKPVDVKFLFIKHPVKWWNQYLQR